MRKEFVLWFTVAPTVREEETSSAAKLTEDGIATVWRHYHPSLSTLISIYRCARPSDVLTKYIIF